jgi:hypothetical protein
VARKGAAVGPEASRGRVDRAGSSFAVAPGFGLVIAATPIPLKSARGAPQVIRGERPCKLYLDIESPIPPGADHAAAVAENEARLDLLLEALRCFILARFSGEVCSPIEITHSLN